MPNRKQIVVIGAGFAGLATVQALKNVDVDIVLIDKSNHHLFQPLLYQVATAALSPAQIAQPIRSILRKQKNCRVILGEVQSINTEKKTIRGKTSEIAYDYLVVATGSTHTYFGHDDWQANAPGLKTINDATTIRHRILSAFEQAEIEHDQQRRDALMTFVIIGGGPTGVEMAGAIAELAKVSLKNDFRLIEPDKTRVILIESGQQLLASFPDKLSQQAYQDLVELGVQIHTGHPVTECTDQGVRVNDEWIPSRTIIWGAGVKASPAAQWLNAEKDRSGRVIVHENLSLPNHPEIFVIGDTAACKNSDGTFLPGLAPVAKQQGKFVAKMLQSILLGSPSTAKFVYKNHGIMATIGRGKAVADLKRFTMHGLSAWCLWGAVHIMPLIGFRNRFIVACDWLWAYLTYERGVRLITVSKDNQGDL